MSRKKWQGKIVRLSIVVFVIAIVLFFGYHYFSWDLGDGIANRYLMDHERMISDGLTKGTLLWNKLKKDIIIGTATITSAFIFIYCMTGYHTEKKIRKEVQLECIEIIANRIKGGEQVDNMLYIDLVRKIDELLDKYDVLEKNSDVISKREEMIASFAHDIKTPLTSVIGYLNLLESDQDISKKSRIKYVKIALAKSLDLEKQLEDLFYISRFDFEHAHHSKNTVNFSSYLTQLVDEFYPNAMDKHMVFNLRMEAEYQIYVDLEKLSKALGNVVSNAIKFGKENTEVKVIVSRNDDVLIIKVANQSDLISKHEISLIFDRFYRRDASRNSEIGGAGLGLAISKAIVEAMDGDIGAEYENGVFSIVVSLPDILAEPIVK